MSRQKSQLKAGVILNYISMGLGNLIPVFYTPVMLSLLGQEEYGLYKLSSSVTSYLGLISLGVGSAVTRYLIKAETEKGKEEEERYLGLFVIIFQAIAAISFVIGLFITLNLQRWYGMSLSVAQLYRMKIIVFLMVCNTALNFSMSPYVSVVTTHERFIFQQCMNIVTTFAAPIINIIVLFLGFKSIAMATASLVMGIVTRAWYYFYVRKNIGIRAKYRSVPTNVLKEILVFSFWIFVGDIVNQLYHATDTVMIGAIPALSTIGVAVYNVGGIFGSISHNLTTGVSALLTPKTNRMVFSGATGRDLTDLAIRIGRIQGFIVTLIVTGFIAFGRPFIRFYVGTEYSEAYWVAVLMMVPNMIPLVQTVCLSILVAQNKHRVRALVYLGIAIINVFGTWFLMQTPLGIIGAALMTGVALVIGQGFVMNWYYWKKTNIQIGRFWINMLELLIIPSILCTLTLLLSRFINFYNLPVMIIGIIVYTIVYFILSWKLVMNAYEKNLLFEIITKRRKI